MNQDTGEIMVSVPIPRRLLWEMRTRYDEPTVNDLLRITYCVQMEMAHAGVCLAVMVSFGFVLLLAAYLPGPVTEQWLALLPIGLLAGLAFLRASRKTAPYRRVRVAIQNANTEKFKRIAEELEPLAKEYLGSEREDATVNLRL